MTRYSYEKTKKQSKTKQNKQTKTKNKNKQNKPSKQVNKQTSKHHNVI